MCILNVLYVLILNIYGCVYINLEGALSVGSFVSCTKWFFATNVKLAVVVIVLHFGENNTTLMFVH